MTLKRALVVVQTDTLDFAPDILAIQESYPSPLPRTLLYVLLSLVAILIAWAIFGRLDVIASSEGKLVPQTYLKILQPADGGIIKEILVQEGQSVQAGQVLMRMDSQLSDADGTIVKNELALKRLQLRRIDAELAGKPLQFQTGDTRELFHQIDAQFLAHTRAYQDAINQERTSLGRAQQDLAASAEIQAKLRQTVPIYEAQADAWKKLGKDGFAPRLIVMDKERERVEKEQDLKAQEYTVASLKASIAQSEQRIVQVTSSYHQQLHNERVDTEAAYRKLQQEWAKQEHKQGLLELKASQSAVVKDLATHTLGTVVSPGTILLTLVPVNEPLQAEVMVKNEDVGFVHEGQNVKVKLSAYPFQKYGMADGTVSHVSADATDQPGDSRKIDEQSTGKAQSPTTYKAIILLKKQSMSADGEILKLVPGMQVVAEIEQGDRTVLEYLLSPIKGAFHEAARER